MATILEQKDENHIDNYGSELVDKFVVLQEQKKEYIKKIEEIKEKIVKFAQQKKVDYVFGTKNKALIQKYSKIEYSNKEKLIHLLKDKGFYEDLVSLNTAKLKFKVEKQQLDEDILENILLKPAFTVRLSKNIKNIKKRKEENSGITLISDDEQEEDYCDIQLSNDNDEQEEKEWEKQEKDYFEIALSEFNNELDKDDNNQEDEPLILADINCISADKNKKYF